MLPGQALHGGIVQRVSQGAGGLDQEAPAAPCNGGGCLGETSAGRGAGPVFTVLAAAVRRAHGPDRCQGLKGRKVGRSPMGEAVFFRQGHKPLHGLPSPLDKAARDC